jgi:predicted N-acyltransferase
MTLYPFQLAKSAAEVDRASWQGVCDPSENPFMDLRFLQAVETSFAADARFWYATVQDDSGRAVACACFSCYTVDGCVLAPPAGQRFVTAVRRWWRSFFRFRVLLGGLPVSTSGGQVALADGVDLDRLAATLDRIATKLADESKAKFISFKEYDPALTEKLAPLERYGYRRAESVVTHWLMGEYPSFNTYYDSRSKRHRANIRRHFRKLESAGLTWVQYRGRDDVGGLFTEDVHRLYLNVFDRSQAKFEILPKSFFPELAQQLPDDSCFTFMFQGERPVGFCCGVASPGGHTLLYCGLDYTLNADADLYFNIIYRGLAQGLVPGVKRVQVGASADEFKKHLGCDQIPLSIFLKARGAVTSFLFHRLFGLLFPDRPTPSNSVDGPHDPAETIRAAD